MTEPQRTSSTATPLPTLNARYSTCLMLAATMLLVGCDANTESDPRLLERAAVLSDRGRFDESLALLGKISDDGGDPEVAYLRGVAYENLQQFDRALDSYTQCLDVRPDHADAFNNRGVIYGRIGKLDLAVADLRRAVDINPDDALAWSNLGLAYHELGDLEQAVNFYSEAYKRSKSPEILYQRGNSYLAAKQYQEAIDDYSEAIKNDSAYARAYLNRAIAYLRVGNANLAIPDLGSAEQFDDDMSITPLVQNLRQSLDRRTIRSKAVELVRQWLEESGWEVNSGGDCPVDFTASRLPEPIDPSGADEEPEERQIPDDFYGVVLIKESDEAVVSDFPLMESAIGLSQRPRDASQMNRLCLFIIDATELGSRRTDPATGQPVWLSQTDYDWRPTSEDIEPYQVRVKVPREAKLASGP